MATTPLPTPEFKQGTDKVLVIVTGGKQVDTKSSDSNVIIQKEE